MVRVARLMRDKAAGNHKSCPSGQSPTQILDKLLGEAHGIIDAQYKALAKEILPGLDSAGLNFVEPHELNASQAAYVEQLFHNEIFPVITPRSIRE